MDSAESARTTLLEFANNRVQKPPGVGAGSRREEDVELEGTGSILSNGDQPRSHMTDKQQLGGNRTGEVSENE